MNTSSKNHDDMCLMGQLSQESILDNLVRRYQQDKIYTSIGPTLISINPYKQIVNLYSPQIVESIKNTILSGDSVKMPHIYAVAGRAFQGMVNQIQKQAIIISGESGAGKTESTKYCMQMLTSLSSNKGHQLPIQGKILACNPILEAFGNSKTVRNENSSRFGKNAQIYFGPDHTIKGASIKSYLLQKSRVTNIAKNERSFHIFYAICESKKYGVKTPQQYRFLNRSNCYTAENISDFYCFHNVCKAMKELGFQDDEQERLWKLLVTLLELGNFEFDDSQRVQNQSLPCKIVNGQKINEIAQMLGMSQEQFSKILLYSKILIPRQQCIFKTMDKNECRANLNTLCKAMYNSMFEWILSKLETSLNPPVEMQDLYRSLRSSYKVNVQEPPPPARFQINLLDIFGFENFQQNSLEQLCINYTNEKLLDLYNRCVFDNEINILREDGLESQIGNIQPPSNDASICLLDAVFRTIKDISRMKQSKDIDIVWEFKTNRANSQYVRTITYDKFDQNLFIVKHSPCSVSYNVNNFKLKNQDRLTPQIQNITLGLFNQRKVQSGRTLLEKFTNQINILTNQLEESTNHYVRCIKPNEEKKNMTTPEFMLRQIKYMGVFETIEIRKRIFPYRRTYQEMAYLFEPIFPQAKSKPPKKAVDIILAELQAKPTTYLLGTRRIYMNEQLQQELNKKLIELDKLRIESANKIKKYYKKLKTRQKLRNCVYDIIARIKVYRKWGQKMDKSMFCGFQSIIQFVMEKLLAQEKAKELDLIAENQKILEGEKEPSKINPLADLCNIIDNEGQDEKGEEGSKFTPFKSLCRMLSQNTQIEEMNIQGHESLPLPLIRKIQPHLQQTHELISEQSKNIQEFQAKQNELEEIIAKSKEKEMEAQQKIALQELSINQLQETLKNKGEQTEYLKHQLELKQEECQELQKKLKASEEKIVQLMKHTPQGIQQRMKKMNEAHHQIPQPLPGMSNWNSVQEQLKQRQMKTQELETAHRESTEKKKELEQMVISYEEMVEDYKLKTSKQEQKIQDLNEKLLKKCTDFEQILCKYHQVQKIQQQIKTRERTKTQSHSTIQKLKANNAFLDKQNRQLRDKIDSQRLINQQYKKLVDNLKNNIQQNSSRMSFESRSSMEFKEVSQQELFGYINSYKAGKSKDQLQNLKQKICYILS